MSTDPGAYDQRYTNYQLQRSGLRKWVRGFYLRSAARLVRGATIDFGCGVGDFLRLLPPGSIGLEINRATVEFCQRQGLDVLHYDGDDDDWSMSPMREAGRQFSSITISHVLEHLHDPVSRLNALLRASRDLGVDRALVIVPGPKGYASDATHLTFVDQSMLRDPRIVEGTGFSVESSSYFPGNTPVIGKWFTHHELRTVFVAPPVGGND